MKKFHQFTLGFIFSLIIMLFFSGCALMNQNENSSTGTSQSTLGNPTLKLVKVDLKNGKTIQFSVELAITENEREKGLMFRQKLNQNTGMLFIYEKPAILSFWMKNTLIPLDMIFIDENFHIVHIAKNVPPCKTDSCDQYSSEKPARYVLEINGGVSENLGIEDGDTISIK